MTWLSVLEMSYTLCMLLCVELITMQLTTEELMLDTEHLSSVLLTTPVYNNVMVTMDAESISKAVAGTMDVLHTASGPAYDLKFYSSLEKHQILIISILQQWLVRYFVKRLMQLMTPEALILNQKKIPHSYLVNYVSYQTHFSLKELIKESLEATNL